MQDSRPGDVPLLSLRNLRIELPTTTGWAEVVRGVDLDIERGSATGIVGESGCGKTMTGRVLLGLLPSLARVSGEALYDGRNLVSLSPTSLDRICGVEIAMVFQDPMTALNPVMTIGAQLTEGLRRKLGMSKPAAWAEAVRLLDLVRIPHARQRLTAYPHELSGGMRQRVLIAAGISMRPKILVADEPTTALDVSVQAEILQLLSGLRRELGMAIILISHDFGVVSHMTDNVAVMYAGRVVEQGTVRDIYRKAKHPYTRGLLNAIPRIDQVRDPMPTIEGTVPSPLSLPPGCAFAARCSNRLPRCSDEVPAMAAVGVQQGVACFNPVSAA